MFGFKLQNIIRYLSVTAVFLLLFTFFISKDKNHGDTNYVLNDSYSFDTTTDIKTSASGCILTDANSGEIIYSENADKVLPMASTTKIMTALVVLENTSLSDTVTVTSESVGTEGSSVYLEKGEVLSVEELLYGLLLESGNDAATALAIHTGKTAEGFCDMMNEKAKSLGLMSTHFDNPHGLSSDSHHTTARELAVITAQALKNDTFKKIVSTKKYHIPARENCRERYFGNHNRLLSSMPLCIGVKTGYTIKSGRCLVTASSDGESTFIAVTLNDRNDFADHTALHSYALENCKSILVAEKGELEYDFKTYKATNKEDIYITVKKNFNEPISLTVNAGNPDSTGAVGTVTVNYGGKTRSFYLHNSIAQ